MKFFILLFAFVSMSVSAQGGAKAKTGKELAMRCAACHGMKGTSNSPKYPNLAGQHSQYIVKQLKDFKSGSRKNSTMGSIARSLKDNEMETVAKYFESQK